MELAASLLLLLIIYFLGCLALVQEVIKPYKAVVKKGSNSKITVTNYTKILVISLSIATVSTTIAYFLFLS